MFRNWRGSPLAALISALGLVIAGSTGCASTDSGAVTRAPSLAPSAPTSSTPSSPPKGDSEIVAYIGDTGGSLISAGAFSHDGELLATGDWEGSVTLWDVPSGSKVRDFPGHGAPMYGRATVRAVAFSPDGRTLATGGDEKLVRLWDVDTGEQIGEPLAVDRSGGPGSHFIDEIVFSGDGRRLAVGGEGVRIYDFETLEPLADGLTLPACGEDPMDMAFRDGGTELVTVCYGKVKRWDVATGSKISETEFFFGRTRHLALSPDATLAALQVGFDVGLFDLDSGERIATVPTDGRTKVSDGAFNGDGTVFAYGGSEEGGGSKLVWRWDVLKQQSIGTPLGSDVTVGALRRSR